MFQRKNQKTIISKFVKKINLLNQPISITDLIVSPVGYSKGEVDKVHRLSDIDPIIRMIDQINILAQIANQYYSDLYVEHSSQVKKNCENKIVRLSTYEFAFYPSEPLTFSQFSTLIGSIEAIVKDHFQNVFLVLSSVAVKNDNRLFNMVIHVQCGTRPNVHVTTKAYPHSIDPTYNYKKFHKFHTPPAKGNYAAPLLNKYPGEAIPYNPIIISKTLGGAEFVTMIDICFDHIKGYAANSCDDVLNGIKKQINIGLFPSQVNYLLTSNTLDEIESKHIKGSIITQVDPSFVGILKLSDNKYISKIKMNEQEFKIQISPEYKTHVSQSNGDTLIENPPFGVCDYKITAYPERIAEKFDKKFLTKVNKINKTIAVNSAKEILHMKSTKRLNQLYTQSRKEIDAKELKDQKKNLKRNREALDNIEENSKAKRPRI